MGVEYQRPVISVQFVSLAEQGERVSPFFLVPLRTFTMIHEYSSCYGLWLSCGNV